MTISEIINLAKSEEKENLKMELKSFRAFFPFTDDNKRKLAHVPGEEIFEIKKLSIIGYQQVTAKLGAAIEINLQGDMAVAAYELYEINTRPSSLLLIFKIRAVYPSLT